MSDTIKNAALAVGWKPEGPKGCYCSKDAKFLRYPFESRGDLHALVGTFEDLVREESPGTTVRVFDGCATVLTKDGSAKVTVGEKDWLMAKLEALWQVWKQRK